MDLTVDLRDLIINVKQCVGKLLSTTIYGPNGKRQLAKGRLLTHENAETLAMEGLSEVPVVELDDNEVGEDAAVMQIANKIGCGSLEVRLALGGRADLFATESCCLLVDEEGLKQVNATGGIGVATAPN